MPEGEEGGVGAGRPDPDARERLQSPATAAHHRRVRGAWRRRAAVAAVFAGLTIGGVAAAPAAHASAGMGPAQPVAVAVAPDPHATATTAPAKPDAGQQQSSSSAKDKQPAPYPFGEAIVLALMNDLPMFLIIGIVAAVFINMRKKGMGMGGGGINSFTRMQKAGVMERPNVKFADVAGHESAKQELGEMVDLLRDPERFAALGAKAPKGALLFGPPGTGKTLLAKAVAGEAEVPFFSISGSDFVEMFVGVGAARARNLFAQAAQNAPAIVFIDEIDAIGRHRGNGMGGGNDEREQTLNQLLVELDGFAERNNVIVIAATNRPDMLDQALLRPGRFDRQIAVPLPDLAARRAILDVHARGKPISADVDLDAVAKGTPGLSGADLAGILNEAAIMAGRAGSATIDDKHIQNAFLRVIAGPEAGSVMSPHERETTAYHEVGHVLGGLLSPESDPVHSVSIIPRGQALGLTISLPEKDQVMLSRRQLEARLVGLFGGRAAEEILRGDGGVTTGASNDIEKATELADNMVRRWALSGNLPPRTYPKSQPGYPDPVTPATARTIESNVDRILTEAADTARTLLSDHWDLVEALSTRLLAEETLTREQILEEVARLQVALPAAPAAPAVEPLAV